MSIKKQVMDDRQAVTFDFGDGSQPVEIRLADLPPDIVTRLALHGLSQKAGDSYASAKAAVESGDYPSAEAFAREQVEGVVAMLTAGQWTSAREGGGGVARVSLLVEAYARLKGCEVAEAKAIIDGLDDDQQKAAREVPAIKAAIATIKAERAAAAAEKASAKAGDTKGLEALGL